MNNVLLEVAGQESLTEIARIHYEALPGDFLPSLGQDFLERVYYPAAIKSKSATTFIARVKGEPVGFVTIAHDSPQFSRDVVESRMLLIARYALRATLRRPFHIFRSAEVFWSALMSKPDPVKGEIVLIAVRREYQGKGIGRKLVRAAMEYLRERGGCYCRTKTLARNGSVIRMYEKMGWKVRDRFRLIGREYVTIISPELC